MRPVILSVVLLLALLPVNAPAQQAVSDTFDGDFVCDRDILRTEVLHVVEPGTLKKLDVSAGRRAATIILNAGPTLAANAAALATWSDAVALGKPCWPTTSR